MKITYCDVCKKAVNEFVIAEVMNGEHPHNGSTVHTDIEICIDCIKKLDLKLSMDLEDIETGKCWKKG